MNVSIFSNVMERKKRKYSVDEKVNLAKIVAKHKDGGGRKSVAVEVREKYLFSYFFRINHQTMLYLFVL